MISAMDYSEAQAAFFAPREGEAQALGWTTPARRLRDALEPIATICYWSEPAYDAYAALGLDFLTGYVWSRASSLGEPTPQVVASAFGVFEPGLVADLYTQGRSTAGLSDVRRAREAGAVTALKQVLGEEPEGLADVVGALEEAAAAGSPVARPFFSGLLDWPEPDTLLGRLWLAATRLRELRGDGHLVAVADAELDGVQANVLTELWVGWEPLAYTGSRAWSPEAMAGATSTLEHRGLVRDDELTDAGRALREGVEEATDRLVVPSVDALGDRLDDVVTRLEGWAEQVVASGWFPPDPYKRAAG